MSYEDGMPAGGNSRFRGYPARMSERQQLALLLQMTSQEVLPGANRTESGSNQSPNTTSRSSSNLQQQRGSKGRWTNKNGESTVQSSINRKEDYRVRQMLANGYDVNVNAKESNDEIDTSTPSNEQDQQQAQTYQHQQQRTTIASSQTAATHIAEDSGDPCEMRRTPPQNKIDRSGTGQSSNSPRVTLRLNQVRGSRDEKKGSNSSSSRQSNMSSQSLSQMDSSKSSSNTSVALGINNPNANTIGNTSSSTIDNNDVYEFKSSKEVASVRGVTSSPNPEKDKDGGKSLGNQTSSNSGQSNNSGGSVSGNNSSESSNVNSIGSVSGTCTVTSNSNSNGNGKDNGNGNANGNDNSNSNISASVNISGNVNNSGSGNVSNNNNGNTDSSVNIGINNIVNANTNANINTSTNINTNTNDKGNSNGNNNGSININANNSNNNCHINSSNTNNNSNSNISNSNSNNSGNIIVSGTVTTSTNCETITMTTSATSLSMDDSPAITTSPSSKRPYEGDNMDEQDDESRRKKRKESEGIKENLKSTGIGRQNNNRASTSTNEKCSKSGKQGTGSVSTKNSQNINSPIVDRKSPNASSMASSPKSLNGSGSASNSKIIMLTPMESDGEDERSKGSDSTGTAPKVPPLKIVIPQSTTSEQEQGNRNGKNTSNRNHQLPYVVASSSNSNDSNDKEQNQSTSGTTSPIENTSSSTSKPEDKKDFSGALHNEERSTHHQRVLRSSHRAGNGSSGSLSTKESSTSSGNGNYSNSSPLYMSATASADRSNNSSPQLRHHSPIPETTGSEVCKTVTYENNSVTVNASKTSVVTEKLEKTPELTIKNQKDGGSENSENSSTPSASTTSNVTAPAQTVELHPRKRKMKPNKEAQAAASSAANEAAETANVGPEVHPHDQPITNCYQLFLNIRKQIERRRKGLFPVQPKPPQGFKDYLMNRCTYVLAGNANKEPNVNPPIGLQGHMKELYVEQEKERYRLRMQHVVEKEKLVLSVEQEILRVHGRAARALANQSLPFSVCTILKDEEVYNVITPEQEEKDRNARSRYNGRLFLSWLQDVDDKWEKIKEAMLLRHHNEAESLHAVQKMDWEWKLKEIGLCEFKATPQIEDMHVPMVHVSDDFDLLPA